MLLVLKQCKRDSISCASTRRLAYLFMYIAISGVCHFILLASYKMMRKCWEMVPDDRPSFEDLHANTSKYTEHIAGYLEMGFNPFASGNRVKSTILESEDVGFESAVAIQVTPASLEEESVDKVFTD